jgi:hypothetical protein
VGDVVDVRGRDMRYQRHPAHKFAARANGPA